MLMSIKRIEEERAWARRIAEMKDGKRQGVIEVEGRRESSPEEGEGREEAGGRLEMRVREEGNLIIYTIDTKGFKPEEIEVSRKTNKYYLTTEDISANRGGVERDYIMSEN